MEVSACRPYQARTKGKTKSGVGYVKRNAIARLTFESFAALEAHLERWRNEADRRIHGTTHERDDGRDRMVARSSRSNRSRGSIVVVWAVFLNAHPACCPHRCCRRGSLTRPADAAWFTVPRRLGLRSAGAFACST